MTKKTETPKAAAVEAAAAAVVAAAYEKAVQAFNDALKLLHEGRLAEAKTAFEAIENSVTDEPALEERARSYRNICQGKLNPQPHSPTSPEECYATAVILANRGEHDEALGLLNRALQEKTLAKYLYARASVYALKGNVEAAVGDLRQAIADEPQIRFQAVNDPDFERIREEPAFIDIIEPTPTGA